MHSEILFEGLISARLCRCAGNIIAIADVLYYVLLKGTLFYQYKLPCNLSCFWMGSTSENANVFFSLFQRYIIPFSSLTKPLALWFGAHFSIDFDPRVF